MAAMSGPSVQTTPLPPPATGAVPIPDPTILTTQQLYREIWSARELVERMVEGQKSVFEARFAGMDKAIGLLQSISDRLPSQMDDKILHLKDLHQEKFDSISVQFTERDTRTEQTAAGVKIAVDAALQAAKEAVAEQNRSFALATGKSETATMKQIDAMGLAIQTANKGLDDKIADMKDRLTRIEGMDLGTTRSHAEHHGAQTIQQGDNRNMIAMLALAVAAAAILITVFHPGATPPLVATIPTSPPALQRNSYTMPTIRPSFRIGEEF